MENIDYKVALATQFKLLKSSSQSYDEGTPEAALQIATTIRVLVHDTKKSQSLLKLMGAKGISLATTAKTLDDSKYYAYLSPLIEIEASFENLAEGPCIDAVPIPLGIGGLIDGHLLSVEEWWNQTIYLIFEGKAYTRRDIVLTAANKDGGAHVADKLPALYAQLSNGTAGTSVVSTDTDGFSIFQIQFVFGDGQIEGKPVKNFQYADIRQMATELLSSPELLALTT
jgi:hypothetical protein